MQSPLFGIGPAKITFTPSSTTNVAQTGHTPGTETVTKHHVTSPMQEPTNNPVIAEEAQITNGMEASADMDVLVTRLGAVADLLETSSADAEGEDDIDEMIVDEMLVSFILSASDYSCFVVHGDSGVLFLSLEGQFDPLFFMSRDVPLASITMFPCHRSTPRPPQSVQVESNPR